MKQVFFFLSVVAFWHLAMTVAGHAQTARPGVTPGEQRTNQAPSEEQLNLVQRLKERPLPGLFYVSVGPSNPQGDFQSNLKTNGFGFAIGGGYHFDPLPIAVGLEGAYVRYGSDERETSGEFFSTERQMRIRFTDTISASNWAVPLHVYIRLMPADGIKEYVFPYLDVYGGVNLLGSTNEYRSSYFQARDDNSVTAQLNGGFGLGLLFKLVDFFELPSTRSMLALDIRMKYIFGQVAVYDAYRGLNQTTFVPEFERVESRTDVIQTLVGVTFRF